MVDYEINEDTLAIIPIIPDKSKIIETNKEYIVNKKVYEIMENSCCYFGSSLSGRTEGSKKLLGTGYKIPIIVEESKEIIFFPTTSPLKNECCWVAIQHIKNCNFFEEDKTIINFENNNELIINVPYFSIKNQILRATRLESILRKRKK